MDPAAPESLLGAPAPGASPTLDPDDAGGIEGKLRMGRAIKALLAREPEPVTVGRYRVVRKIGAGGMSVVYAARDDELDREVAIKVLRATSSSAPAWPQRLRREATAMARLSHVNIAHVYEVGEHEGSPFIAMELIAGTTLREWLAERPRSVPEILAIHVQAARGLAAAHASGLVHRDFKPDNVIVDHNGWARVLDFGLVLAEGEVASPPAAEPVTGAESGRGNVRTTRPGTVVGTPAYMAPEQMEGHAVDARADQFALCVALFEALHGERPFPGGSLTEISDSIRSGRVRPIVAPVTDNVSESIAKVIARGLEIEPVHRYASMNALIDALILAQQQRERAEQSELQRKADALDTQPSADVRWQHSVLIGVVLATIVGVFFALRVMGIHRAGYPDAIGFGVVLVLLQLFSERRISAAGANAFGQRWARMLTVGSSVVVLSLSFCWLAQLEFTLGLAVTFLAAGCASTSVILFVDPRLVVSSIFLLATAPALVLAPSYRPLWLIVGLLGAYASLALVWRQRTPDQTDRPS